MGTGSGTGNAVFASGPGADASGSVNTTVVAVISADRFFPSVAPSGLPGDYGTGQASACRNGNAAVDCALHSFHKFLRPNISEMAHSLQ